MSHYLSPHPHPAQLGPLVLLPTLLGPHRLWACFPPLWVTHLGLLPPQHASLHLLFQRSSFPRRAGQSAGGGRPKGVGLSRVESCANGASGGREGPGRPGAGHVSALEMPQCRSTPYIPEPSPPTKAPCAPFNNSCNHLTNPMGKMSIMVIK